MLYGLWLDPFLGGDHQHDSTNKASPGKHVVNEKAVAGDIDKADSDRRTVRRHDIEEGEAEIDGDATPLLFRQAIRIDTSECMDQRGLAVIDVACRSDNYGLGGCRHALWAGAGSCAICCSRE